MSMTPAAQCARALSGNLRCVKVTYCTRQLYRTNSITSVPFVEHWSTVYASPTHSSRHLSDRGQQLRDVIVIGLQRTN